MFDPSDHPRIFGLPAGIDFATSVTHGLMSRLDDTTPEALGRVTIYVNTRRMQRRIRTVFDQGPARILPKVRLITDLALDPISSTLPPPASPLRRRLELSQLVAALLDQEHELAPRSALFDLADSLAALIDEMQGEGVTPDVIKALDVTDLSGHWERSLKFIQLIQTYFDPDQTAPDREARQRQVIEALIENWRATPPTDPIIVAGSTGSRGATGLLLAAVARLPQGAVILPGFDFDLPASVWSTLADPLTAEDHPQARFERLTTTLGMDPKSIPAWHDAPAPNPARNALVSLALRPAPVTDQWRKDGPDLGPLDIATKGLTLLEAPSPRLEAEAIALRLRQAADEGITAALITPDRMLTRQVAAALDRWHITPDDSAGMPLPLSPPGRLLRQTAALMGATLTAEALLSLLKHPLCHSTDGRNNHLRWTHDLELHLRRYGPPFPDAASLRDWAETTGKNDPGRAAWAHWLGTTLEGCHDVGMAPLEHHLQHHLRVSSALAAGPDTSASGALWDQAAGRTAKRLFDDLGQHADAGGILSPSDYAALVNTLLNGGEVRDRDRGHPNILIWGTLEARVQSADLIILASLNEGSWPEAPKPDPWLNRVMRAKAGLLLPERRIGLAAHDFTQAVAGKDVWITRAIRSDDSQTVPSRWINRITNLLGGLPEQGGPEALDHMRARGNTWIAAAKQLSDTPIADAAPRPSPQPPLDHRPNALSVTSITRLIRDPYAIYAAKILRLSALNPLTPTADAPLRGTVLHQVFEEFIKHCADPAAPSARDELMATAQTVLDAACPWPTNRHLWLARIDGIADWFLTTEIIRRQTAAPANMFEAKGTVTIDDLGFTLFGYADRIDLSPDGQAVLYDYKTGKPPTEKQQRSFDKQLLLEAAMIAQGGFENLGPRAVLAASYIGLGTSPSEVRVPLDDLPPDLVWSQLRDLISKWQDPDRGYSARLSPQFITYDGDYDHLSRFGEWDQSTDVTPEVLK